MTLVTDRKDLDTTLLPSGQQATYLVLSDEERAKGYVRPVRDTYRHVGTPGPKHQLRELTAEELKYNEGQPPEERFAKFEVYPEGKSSMGRFWTQVELDNVGKGCQATTTMARALAETYARDPSFYGGTFCVSCGKHLPVGADGEFVWDDSEGSRVGT